MDLKLKIILVNILYELKTILISDKKFAEIRYKKWKEKKLNFEDTKTFSEKLQYLKLYYRNPLMCVCADKYYARDYVRACGYENILKDIYAVYNNVEDINYQQLPDKFFVRWNHMSGGNFIIEKGKDSSETIKLLKLYKYINWYKQGREWQYKNIVKKLICEEYLHNKDNSLLVDYKLYCFDGKVRYYMISYGEFEHKYLNHKFDTEGRSIDSFFKKTETISASDISIPDNMSEMINIAEDLSKPFPHVRIDFYNINGRIVFGEMTFFSNSGFVDIYSEEMDKQIGNWIDLEKYKADMINSRN